MPDPWYIALSYADKCTNRKQRLDAGLAELGALLTTAEGIEAAYVFGSYARDQVGPTSDLDVLIVRETDLPVTSRADDIYRAFAGSVGVDLWVVTPSELRNRLPQTAFGQTMLSEGRRFVARSNGYPERLSDLAK